MEDGPSDFRVAELQQELDEWRACADQLAEDVKTYASYHGETRDSLAEYERLKAGDR